MQVYIELSVVHGPLQSPPGLLLLLVLNFFQVGLFALINSPTVQYIVPDSLFVRVESKTAIFVARLYTWAIAFTMVRVSIEQ